MTPESTSNDTPATPKAPKTRKPRQARAARAQAAPVSAPVTGGVSQDDFLGSVKAIIEATKPPVKITVDNRIPHNPMNPNNDPRPPFKYPFYQNFDKVAPEDLLPEEYLLVPQLKPGQFVKSRRGIPLVEVVLVKRGSHRGIHMRYDNKGDKGRELATYVRDMTEMMQRCIREAAQQAQVKATRRAAGLPEDSDDDD